MGRWERREGPEGVFWAFVTKIGEVVAIRHTEPGSKPHPLKVKVTYGYNPKKEE